MEKSVGGKRWETTKIPSFSLKAPQKVVGNAILGGNCITSKTSCFARVVG